MKKFNFFGVQGELKDVQEVIEERVRQILTQKREKEKLEKTMRSLTTEVESQKVSADEILGHYRRLYEHSQELERKLVEKEIQLNALLRIATKREAPRPLTVKELSFQISSLQNQLRVLQRELDELEKGEKIKIN